MFGLIFGNSITRKVERKQMLEGEIAVLKKKQKVKCEAIVNEYEQKKAEVIDNIDAQINMYKAKIVSLKAQQVNDCKMLAEEQKVVLDKTINELDMKIASKQNKVRRLVRYIDAEKQNNDDVITHGLQPNAPTQVLLEDKSTSKKKQ